MGWGPKTIIKTLKHKLMGSQWLCVCFYVDFMVKSYSPSLTN